MKLKTFLATYLLFLFILYLSLGIVSVYMTNSQLSMLKEKGVTEYQTIAASLTKDIAVIYGRSTNISEDVNRLTKDYAKYYEKNSIYIELTDLSLEAQENSSHEVSLLSREQEHFIFVTGMLSEPFQYYRLDYYCNITQSIEDIDKVVGNTVYVTAPKIGSSGEYGDELLQQAKRLLNTGETK